MKLLMYILLGLIQGITEPIPVSSSGHLTIFNALLNVEEFNDLNFEIFTNFGSFIAICIFYRKEIIKIISDFFMYLKTKEKSYRTNYNYAWLIVIGVIPVGIAGLFLKDTIEKITTTKLVGISLLITALLLFIIRNFKGKRTKEDMSIKDALCIGLCQVIALFPGISRSGSTLVGGMSRHLDKETAFNYSFMLYLPVSIGTIILGVKDLIEEGLISELIIPYIIGMIISGIFTYISIGWFKNIIKEGKLIYFVYYCLVVGLLTIIFI